MQWTDRGLILSARRHGESSVILEAMTENHGRHLGLVRGGASRRLRPILQAGNEVDLTWRARLHEHLGAMRAELILARAGQWMESRLCLDGLQSLCALLRLLPEREPHPGLYHAAQIVLEQHNEPLIMAELFVRFELKLLTVLGFGLDLQSCAATGAKNALAYVSPKSGRAVSAEAGAPWKDKLLPLPAFLATAQTAAAPRTKQELNFGFALTGYFLGRHVFQARGLKMPDARAWLIERLFD